MGLQVGWWPQDSRWTHSNAWILGSREPFLAVPEMPQQKMPGSFKVRKRLDHCCWQRFQEFSRILEQPLADSQCRKQDFSPTTTGNWILPAFWLSRVRDPSLVRTETNTDLLKPWFQPGETWVRPWAQKTVRIMHLHCFKLLNFRQFVTQQ